MGKRILLISKPRTCGHLLERMLSEQPGVKYLSHPLAGAARPVRIRLIERGSLATAALQDELMAAVEKGYRDMQNLFAEAAEEGKTAFVHEHFHYAERPNLISQYIYGDGGYAKRSWNVAADEEPDNHYTNPTMLPDELYLHPDTICILTTRPPELMIPALYWAITRTEAALQGLGEKTWSVTSYYGWQLLLLDWLHEHNVWPIVIDAADFAAADLQSCKKLINLLCKRTGLKPEAVIYNWPKASHPELTALPPETLSIFGTLLGSDGFTPELARTPLVQDDTLEAYQYKFGKELGSIVKDKIEESLPLYEHLCEYKLRVVE